jgi:HTH-type transcriptional regulator / antitoxin HigA
MEKQIMSTVNKTHKIIIPEKWDDLVRNLWLLRPIHTASDYETALEVAGELTAKKKLNKDQTDYLESLATLIEAYEAEHYPIETAGRSPIEILKSLLEMNNMTGSDLGRVLGQRQLGAKILSGVRQLSKTQIKQLAEFFSVEPCLFL